MLIKLNNTSKIVIGKYQMANENKNSSENVKITLVKGVYGFSVYINDHRVAGGKPWGGGQVIKEWILLKESINAALKINFKDRGVE